MSISGKLLATVNSDKNTGVRYTYDAMDRLIEVHPATYVSSTFYAPICQFLFGEIGGAIMGIADFYLKIKFKNYNIDEFTSIYQSFANEKIFRILDKESELNYLSIECKFDILIPSIVIVFENLHQHKNNIDSIETYGIITKFDFDTVEDFLRCVFYCNKDKLLSYYNQLGYFAIDADNYYKTRIKLRKYYKKLE
ncbi:MAG: hypothetical protein E7617_02250 [Ruminococcaceae bacterium]|nr:hypothetical protein [Oscillospiraceae bacterium]